MWQKGGCFEQYASVNALIRQTREASEKYPESVLARIANVGISGRTVFEAAQKDCHVAKRVLEKYTEYLAMGIMDLQWILAPEAIVIGGAVSEQREHLLGPVRQKIGTDINLVVSELQNDAGIIGAVVAAEYLSR